MRVIALIPARGGSRGIPRKNLRKLGGKTLVRRAIDVACAVLPPADVFVSTEDEEIALEAGSHTLERPETLARDETPMLDVVKHAIEALRLKLEDVVVLFQPTSPFRTAAHVRAALGILREGLVDSVVSVRQVPPEFHPRYIARIGRERLHFEGALPTRRQDLETLYVPDGTVYAFWVKNVLVHHDFLGWNTAPLILEVGESLNLNTEADWREAERRLRELAVA